MAEINAKAYLVLAARLAVAAAFILAALPKIQDPVAFATSVEAYRVVGSELSGWTALVLPWLELIIGVGIMAPQLRRTSSLIAIFLLVLFISLHASAWTRGLDISCGCFGQSETEKTPNYLLLILRNLSLLLAAGVVFVRDLRNPRFFKGTKAESIS